MKKNIAVFILSGFAVLLPAFSGCAVQVVARPREATLIASPGSRPAEVLRVSQEYRDNPILADTEYQGKRLLFTEVRVESIVRSSGNYYFTVGNLRFRPTIQGDLDYLAEGTLVNVAGECQGQLWSYVYFNDCWIGILSGGLAAPRSGY